MQKNIYRRNDSFHISQRKKARSVAQTVELFKSFSKRRIGCIQVRYNDFNRMETEQSENVHLNYSSSCVRTNSLVTTAHPNALLGAQRIDPL